MMGVYSLALVCFGDDSTMYVCIGSCTTSAIPVRHDFTHPSVRNCSAHIYYHLNCYEVCISSINHPHVSVLVGMYILAYRRLANSQGPSCHIQASSAPPNVLVCSMCLVEHVGRQICPMMLLQRNFITFCCQISSKSVFIHLTFC